MQIRIPKRNKHPVVGDNLTRFYHYPVLNYFFLRRLTMALGFMPDGKFDSVLEIGFGSGVFLPELSMRSKRLFGLDVHEHIVKVKGMLRSENIKAELIKGSIVHLPYKDASFDCVISIATLEHINELSLAISEIMRVLKKGGLMILGFPVENKLSDLLLVLTGSVRAYKKKLKEIHPNSHNKIISEIKRQCGNDMKIRLFPNFLPLDLALYCSCMSRKV